MTNINATATHTFACFNPDTRDFTFVSTTAGDHTADVVYARTDGDLYDGFMSVEWAREVYSMAKASGTLMSTEAAQSVIDGEASLVCFTQRGRAFYRAVKGSPFRYAEGCMKRSGLATGYDVVISN